MISLLPIQHNYINHLSQWEYNIGIVCEFNNGIFLSKHQVETALSNVVDTQEHLHQVYDRKLKKVVYKQTSQLINVDEITMNASIEDCTDYLQTLIGEKSKSIFKEQNYHIHITLCNTPIKQLCIFVIDHFISDGASMALTLKLLETRILLNQDLPKTNVAAKLESILEDHRSVDLNELNYWQTKTKEKKEEVESYLNKDQENLLLRLGIDLTNKTSNKIKQNKLKFDSLLLSAFQYAYTTVIGGEVGAIEIAKNIRHYLKMSELFFSSGPLVLFFPLRLEHRPDSLQASNELIMNQLKQVKGKELSYSLLSSEGKIPSYPSKILYSNMGNLDEFDDLCDIMSLSKKPEGYFHGETFDKNMSCDKDLFIRPYTLQGSQVLWISYNPNKYSKDQINKILEITLSGFLDLIELKSKANVLAYD